MLSLFDKLAVALGLRKSIADARPISHTELKDAALRDGPGVLAFLNSAPEGLSTIQALARRAREGLNEIASERPPHWLIQLLHAFNVPFNYLLLTLALVSFATEDYRAATVISLMVALSGSVRFWQEFRSNRAAEKLRALVRTTATVSRPITPEEGDAATEPSPAPTCRAVLQEVPLRDLVPGDVIQLSAGDLIPADVRILSAKDLFVSQSSLTGESMPVEKMDLPGADAQRLLANSSLLELPSVCFMGIDRGERHGPRRRGRDRKPHLSRQSRQAPRRPARRDRLRQGRPRRQLAADPLHAGDGPDCLRSQRLHQRGLVRGLHVRGRGRGGTDARDAADDRHDQPCQRGRGHVPPQGDRQEAHRDPEPRRDGRALHRQDRHAHPGQGGPDPAPRSSTARNARRCSNTPT